MDSKSLFEEERRAERKRKVRLFDVFKKQLLLIAFILKKIAEVGNHLKVAVGDGSLLARGKNAPVGDTMRASQK